MTIILLQIFQFCVGLYQCKLVKNGLLIDVNNTLMNVYESDQICVCTDLRNIVEELINGLPVPFESSGIKNSVRFSLCMIVLL